MIFEGLFLIGGGLFLYRDSKNDFIKTKMLIEKVSLGKIKLIEKSKEDVRVFKAENAVQEKAKRVAKLEHAISGVESNLKQHQRLAAEQAMLAQQFAGLLEKAVLQNDKEAETLAASSKIEAQRRSRLFQSLAESEAKTLPSLMRDLEIAHFELSVSQDKASTVKAYVDVAQAGRELYELKSNVDVSNGLTADGDLNEALLESEREMYRSESLLGMARRNNRKDSEMLLASAEIDQEIEAVRKRVALPEARNYEEPLEVVGHE